MAATTVVYRAGNRKEALRLSACAVRASYLCGEDALCYVEVALEAAAAARGTRARDSTSKRRASQRANELSFVALSVDFRGERLSSAAAKRACMCREAVAAQIRDSLLPAQQGVNKGAGCIAETQCASHTCVCALV